MLKDQSIDISFCDNNFWLNTKTRPLTYHKLYGSVAGRITHEASYNLTHHEKCSNPIRDRFFISRPAVTLKGTLIQVWKSANILVFMWKYVEDFTIKHLLVFEIYAREICEKFV